LYTSIFVYRFLTFLYTLFVYKFYYFYLYTNSTTFICIQILLLLFVYKFYYFYLYASTSRETQELSTAGLSQGFLTVNWLSKRAYNSRHPLETASNSVNCRTFTRLFNGKLAVKTGLKQSSSVRNGLNSCVLHSVNCRK
jgi:hypothetical protein